MKKNTWEGLLKSIGELKMTPERVLSTFQRLSIPIPPFLERAFGYYGDSRFVCFHWLGSDKVQMNDGGLTFHYADTHAWPLFANHPMIAPHLKPFRFHSTRKRDLFLLDRQERVAYVARATSVMAFMILYDLERRGLLELLHQAHDRLDPEVDRESDEDALDVDDLETMSNEEPEAFGIHPMPASPQAERALADWLETLLDDPQAHYQLGILYSDRFQPRNAIRSFTRAIRLESDFFEALVELGHQYRRLTLSRLRPSAASFKGAIQVFTDAIALRPEAGGGHAGLADAYLSLEDYPKALRAYQRAVLLKPDYRLLHSLGRVLAALGEYE